MSTTHLLHVGFWSAVKMGFDLGQVADHVHVIQKAFGQHSLHFRHDQASGVQEASHCQVSISQL